MAKAAVFPTPLAVRDGLRAPKCGIRGIIRSMATLLAMILSTILAYLPIMVFGDSMSDMTQIVVSSVVGLVTFAWLQWWLRRLKGG